MEYLLLSPVVVNCNLYHNEASNIAISKTTDIEMSLSTNFDLSPDFSYVLRSNLRFNIDNFLQVLHNLRSSYPLNTSHSPLHQYHITGSLPNEVLKPSPARVDPESPPAVARAAQL
jgi:hypothetical protein